MFIINYNQYSGACSWYRTVIIRLGFKPMFKHKTYYKHVNSYLCLTCPMTHNECSISSMWSIAIFHFTITELRICRKNSQGLSENE